MAPVVSFLLLPRPRAQLSCEELCDDSRQVFRPEDAAPRRERPGAPAGNDKAREKEHVEEGVDFIREKRLVIGREDSLPTPRLR